MTGRPNVLHAKERAIVSAPGHLPGTTITGRLIAIRRGNAIIVLPSGKHVTRPLHNVTLAFPTAPRVAP